MESIILLVLGILISIILIIFGIILIYYNNAVYEKTHGVIEEAECALDRNIKNFVYNCKIKVYHVVGNKKYINFKDVKTSLIPYRKYDKIDIWYNKNKPEEIITSEGSEDFYAYIPLVLGIIFLIVTILLYVFFSF